MLNKMKKEEENEMSLFEQLKEMYPEAESSIIDLEDEILGSDEEDFEDEEMMEDGMELEGEEDDSEDMSYLEDDEEDLSFLEEDYEDEDMMDEEMPKKKKPKK